MPAEKSNYVSDSFLLKLEGMPGGFVKSVDGGGITAEVLHETIGSDYFVKKHIGALKYEDFILQMDLSMAKAVYDWIATSWMGNFIRKDGAIVAVDDQMEAKSTREFFGALITETTIPAMDASSKEPAFLTLKFAPELTRFKKVAGKVTSEGGKGRQKTWLPSNFRLEIDGLDCNKVSKIEAFSVKQKAAANEVGEERDYQIKPGRIEFPNLKIMLPESAAQTWMDWYEDFVIKGNNAESQEKNGVLTFRAVDYKQELAHVNFFKLGIFRLAPEKSEANTDKVKRLIAELYCERMEFSYTTTEEPMPGWSGCDVCKVIDALRLALGENSFSEGSTFSDPQLSALEERLKTEQDAPLSHRALIVAEGLLEVGMADVALQISEGIPRIVTTTDTTSASLLGRALIIRARSLDTLGKTTEANSAFAMAEHLHTLAGRTQRFS